MHLLKAMINLKNAVLLLVLIPLFLSCSKTDNTLNGDLYFVLLDASNYQIISEDRRRAYKETAERFATQDSLNASQQALVTNYEFLKRNDVLDKPKIFIKEPSGSVHEIYISLEDFKEISGYPLKDLIENNQRVFMEMQIDSSEDGLAVATKIHTIQKMDGQTFYKQN